jgi:hypothetical protein
LRAQAQAGEIELAYLDEGGFAQVPPNRNAWTRRSQRHCIDATRGKRLNVMAAFLNRGRVFSARIWRSFNGELFTAFLSLLRQYVSQYANKPLTVILDNVPFHNSKAIRPYLELLRAQGVTLYFLPPYSPQLNRVEKLWQLIKYYWLPLRRRDPDVLERDVGSILDNFGVDYKMSF